MFRKYLLQLLFLQFFILYRRSSNANPLMGTKVKPAKYSEFPFIVSLSEFSNDVQLRINHHRCGGAVISKKHVLTAAHCIRNLNPRDYVIIAGNINRELGLMYDIDSWISYDEWARMNNVIPQYYDNDIAIITLSKSITYVKPGVISELPHDEVIGKRVVTAGWGYANQSVFLRDKMLQKARLRVISLERHEKIMENYPISKIVDALPNKYYTYAKPNVIITDGDSGSPLLLRSSREIVGINDSCCNVTEPDEVKNAITYHVAVDYYRDFIRNITAE